MLRTQPPTLTFRPRYCSLFLYISLTVVKVSIDSASVFCAPLLWRSSLPSDKTQKSNPFCRYHFIMFYVIRKGQIHIFPELPL